MLNQGFESIASQPSSPSESANGLFRLTLSGVPEALTCKVIVSSADLSHYLPNSSLEATQVSEEKEITVYGIVVVKSSISLRSFSDVSVPDEQHSPEEIEKMIDAGMLVFPPGELPTGTAPGAVNVLINGEGVSSCPRGEGKNAQAKISGLVGCSDFYSYLAILYFTSRLPPNVVLEGPEGNYAEQLLAPYLEATLSSIIPWQDPKTERHVSPTIVFKAFYTRTASPSSPNQPDNNVVLCAPLASHIAQSGDDAASKAETVFRTALKKLGVDESDGPLPFWPPLDAGGDDDDDD